MISRRHPGGALRAGLTFLSLALLSLGMPACGRLERGPEPVPAGVHFLGSVSLYQVPGRAPEYRYEAGRSLRLLLETPPRGAPGGCDPFAGGSLEARFLDPAGEAVHALLIPLEPPYIEPVFNDYLMRVVPASRVEGPGKPVKPWLLPEKFGRWHLELTWRCSGESGRTRRTDLPFWVHPEYELEPSAASFWAPLSDVSQLPAAVQVSRLEAALPGAPGAEARMWVMRRLTRALYEAGRFPDAERMGLEAARAAEAAGFPSEAVLSRIAAYEAAREQGRLVDALGYLDAALEEATRLEFRARMAELWYSRAVLLDRLGQPLEALEAAARAQELAVRTDRTMMRLGARQLELELLQALGHHQAVNRRLEEMLSQPGSDASVLNNAGWLILRGVEAGMPLGGDDAGALTRAEQAFRQSLEGFQAAGNVVFEAHARANLVEVAVLHGQAGAARTLLGEAVAAAGAAPSPTLEPYLRWLTGRVALLEGKTREALRTFEQLEARAEAADQVEYAGRAAFGQGEAWRALGDRDRAIETYDRALGWIQEDSAIHSPLHQASILSNRALWEARAVETRLQAGRVLEALDVIEHGAWARRQSLTRAARRAQLPAEAQRRAHEMRAELEVLDRELVRLRRLSRPETAMQREQKEELRQRLWARLEVLQGGSSPEAPPMLSLEALRALVPPGGRVMRLALLPEALVVWEIDAGGLRVRRVELDRATLERQLEAFTRSCLDGAPDRKLGETLRTALLGGDGGDLPAELLVVAEGPLRTLPWAALPVGEGYLLERTVLRFLPTLLWQPPAEGMALERKIIVADPARDLPEAAREGEALARRFPDAMLLSREAATRAVVFERLARAGLFHYAGHAVTDLERPYLSHLRLTRDERLSLMEIQGLELEGRPLVFLNACAAARVARDGGGAIGIADGFLAAGARAVIASRWDVPDRIAGRIAAMFYERLLEPGGAGSPLLALTETQRALARGEAGEEGRQASAWSAFLYLGAAR